MYIVLRINSSVLLERVRKYLKRIGCWAREFNDPEYRVQVTAEERQKHLQVVRDGNLNPGAAWKTCASFVRAWDWDSLNRGPYPKSDYELKRTHDTAPRGKGYVIINGTKQRIAGECANPTFLNYISCPMWCTKYQPTNIEAAVFIAMEVAKEHERRAAVLYRHIESFKDADKKYREAIHEGCVFNSDDEKFKVLPERVK